MIKLMDLLAPMFRIIANGVASLIHVIQSLPAGIRELGIIGFLMLGRLGKGVVLIIGGAFDEIRSILGDLANAYAFFLEKIAICSIVLYVDVSKTYSNVLGSNSSRVLCKFFNLSVLPIS